MPICPVHIGNTVFPTRREACRHFNIPFNTCNHRLDRGWTIEQALGIAPRPRKKFHNHWSRDGIFAADGSIAAYGCYRLYEIVNKLNDKTYVGLTVQELLMRWKHHIHLVRAGMKHPLYNAMRKYGVENFEIRLIRQDAESGAELQRQEIAEIERRRTTDRARGYNLYHGGQAGNGKSIAIAGLRFNTHAEAARYYGISSGTFDLRLRVCGWTPEQAAEIEPPPNIMRHNLDINGERVSLKEAAKRLGLNYKNVHYHFRHGWTINQVLGLEPPPDEGARLHMAVEIDSKTYPTLSSAAEAYGVGYSTVHNRVRYQNLTVRQALGLDLR